MTHCSLMGSSDLFTNTGKWHFPDTPDVQSQLFENVAWLFDREIYHYISERQTPHFPFIEDFDIQAPVDWATAPPGRERPDPPDDLIIFKPKRDEKTGRVHGHPGHMMCRRAEAIHMIYPNLDYLEVHVYSASGYNKRKEMLKSSFHLVWPQLIVNADRAPVMSRWGYSKETLTSLVPRSARCKRISYACMKATNGSWFSTVPRSMHAMDCVSPTVTRLQWL